MRLKIILAGIFLTMILSPAAALANDVIDDWERGISVLSATSEHEPATFVTTTRLILRSQPSRESTRIKVSEIGAHIEVLDYRCGEWYEVIFNGTSGFMSAEHLRPLTDDDLAPPTVVAVAGATVSLTSIGNVELLEWSEAKKLMTYGTVATLIDVRTGLSWKIASFSNGNHADIETISAEDTAIKLQAFGGSWTWTPRPVIVQINGRNIAASVNGMPHAGSTRKNNMNGHVCLHFLGSTTHTATVSHTRDHQNAVKEAFNTASNW